MRQIIVALTLVLVLGVPALAQELCLQDYLGSTWTLRAAQGVVTGTWQPSAAYPVPGEPVPVWGTVLGRPDRTIIALSGVVGGLESEEMFPAWMIGPLLVRMTLPIDAPGWVDLAIPLGAWSLIEISPCQAAPPDPATSEAPAQDATIWTVRVPESWFDLGERERAEGRR